MLKNNLEVGKLRLRKPSFIRKLKKVDTSILNNYANNISDIISIIRKNECIISPDGNNVNINNLSFMIMNNTSLICIKKNNSDSNIVELRLDKYKNEVLPFNVLIMNKFGEGITALSYNDISGIKNYTLEEIDINEFDIYDYYKLNTIRG